MATKKTTTASGTSTGGTPKKPTARKTAASSRKPASKASPKAEPVVLDPPKKTQPAATPKAPETIDAKATEVKTTAPADTTETKKPDAPAKPSDSLKPAPAKTDTETKPEKPGPTDSPSTTDTPKRSGFAGVFAGFVVGGVVAAGIGYLAADYINPTVVVPDRTAEIAELSSANAALADRIAALETARSESPLTKVDEELKRLQAVLAEQSAGLNTRLAKTEASLADALQQLEVARERLNENLAVTGGDVSAATSELIAKYGAEIDALKTQIQAQISDRAALEARLDDLAAKAGEQLDQARTKAAELTEAATAAAQNIDLTLARERLKAAVETGKSYADQLAEIAAEAAVEIPAALMGKADVGVVTLPELQQSFPAAARKALKASIKAAAGDGMGNQLTAFLQSQLGARSLEEREGDDPDAILSRAEAALKRGELQASVDLIGQLPEAGQVAMQDWVTDAAALLEVQGALMEFDATLDDRN